MSTVRQRHQAIALADILIDQDTKFDPTRSIVSDVHNSNSSGNIHIVMPETRFLSSHPSTCSVRTPSTLSYQSHQDMTPYTSVSSFNYPATADATLLTPVSGAGSPALPGQSLKMAMRSSYPQSSGPSQQPSPPTPRGGMPYTNYPAVYDGLPSSSTPSPMTHHSQQFSTTPYLDQSPHHGHSPRDDIPPQDPQNNYLSHFAVSVPESETPCSFNGYHNNFNQLAPRYMAGSGEPLSHMNPQIITTTAPQAPILTSPDRGQYHRISMTPCPGDIQDLSGPMSMGHQNHTTYQPQPSHSSRSKRGGGKPVHKIPSKKTGNRRPVLQPSRTAELAEAQVACQHNEDDNEAETLTLNDMCEDDLRFIFETRKELVRSGLKGKGMWEEICNRYHKQYEQRLEKPALQMRHSRCVAKYAIWPQYEIDALTRAYEEESKSFHKRVLERMREYGGCRAYNFTEGLIEAKLIDLGFEEKDVNEQTKTRRRRRLARRRRQVEGRQSSSISSHLEQQQQQWGNQLGIHQPALHTPDEQDDMEEYIPDYTHEQREEYIRDIIKEEQFNSSPDPDHMEVAYQHTQREQEAGRDNRGMLQHPHQTQQQQHQQSTRVAKQAVEQVQRLLTGHM